MFDCYENSATKVRGNLVKMRSEGMGLFTELSSLLSDRCFTQIEIKDKRKVQGVPQSQAAALPRHREEEETDKKQTSANPTNVRKTLRLAISLPQVR